MQTSNLNNYKKEDIDIKKEYGDSCILTSNEFIKNYNININSGLTSEEAKTQIKHLGLNEIEQKKPKGWSYYFFKSLFTPFNLILLGITLVLFYTDVILTKPPNYANIIVILVLVLISTLLDFFEEYRSNKSAEKLKELVATTSVVIRDGKEVQIPVENVTLSDIVILSAGSMIPADLRVLESKDLYVGQSTLTGESDSVKKLSNSELTLSSINSVSDLDTICLMGTNVISGSAKCTVIKIANDTYFGKIATSLEKGKPKTAFQSGTENISKLLIRFMLIMIPIVFVLNIWKQNALIAFTFAVAIAIGITPLLLPVILSSSLSKGAIKMSKKKTIVKQLDSIQNFGAMNILCTDKTGTLTEDRIVLEKYLDIKGEEDLRILKHAFLNSYFQSGLKSNIDEAIIKRSLENGIDNLKNKYTKIDEIPFDFSRRCLSVIVKDQNNKKQLITKGAVEEILNICTMFDYKGSVSYLRKENKQNMLNIAKSLNEQGLRVVAICQKNDIEDIKDFNINCEKNMILIGFVGFLDPPKESAKLSIKRLNNSGIRVVVLTGDNAEVTKSVCQKVEINSENIVLGNEVDKLSDIATIQLLRRTNILAKLSPIQKARIVRLLKSDKNIVGYIGDGINDSPSLTNSDVGISVDTAVDIAKESADIILLEKDLNVLLDRSYRRKKNFF